MVIEVTGICHEPLPVCQEIVNYLQKFHSGCLRRLLKNPRTSRVSYLGADIGGGDEGASPEGAVTEERRL